MLKHNKRTVGIRVRHIEKIEPSVKPITFLYRYILEVLAEKARSYSWYGKAVTMIYSYG